MAARKLPVGIQDFTDLILGNYIYVDKTQLLYRLITEGKPYFLSRPRRFGKSITISTLQAIFLGRRDLFKDLWIAQSDWDWQVYPIIKLDMSQINNDNADIYKTALINRLQELANQHQLQLTGDSPADFLRNLIIQLHTKYQKKVVILIDEYDKPLIDRLRQTEIAKSIREVLKNFYGILKTQDADIQFTFLTGVTKFSKVSVFSGLNNLDDLTMANDFSTLTGYTRDELERYFDKQIIDLAKHLQIKVQKCYDEIKLWYNGYRFSKTGKHVYNPFSVLRLLKHKDFSAHWFQTGTPGFLLNLISQHEYDPNQLECMRVSASSFESFDVNTIPVLPLLYQTGYLTIQDYDPNAQAFTLCYPNREVHQAFTESLLSYFSVRKTEVSKYLIDLYYNLDESAWQTNDFIDIIKKILDLIPYDLYIKQEKHYQSLFYLIMRLTGIKLNAEFKTKLGRADACLLMHNKIIIFEFKLDKTAQEGMEQIHEKKYYSMFADQNLPLFLVAINFNSKTRTIDNYIVERKQI